MSHNFAQCDVTSENESSFTRRLAYLSHIRSIYEPMQVSPQNVPTTILHTVCYTMYVECSVDPISLIVSSHL